MSMKPFIIAARYKYLLIVPFAVILPVAIIFAALQRTSNYTSWSNLWVEQPLSPTVDSGNSFLTPAQNRANDLTELLATDSFTMKVAQKANLPTGTETEKNTSLAAIRSGTSASATGRQLVSVSHTDNNPADAHRIADAVVTTYIADTDARTKVLIQQAVLFDQSNVDAAQKALADAQSAVTGYHGSGGSTDPQLTSLISSAQAAQATLNDANKQLRSDQQLLESPGTTNLMSVTDQASTPTSPDGVKKTKLLMFPAAGMLLAISLAAALFGFVLRTDNSIRVAEDLQALPGLLLLGSVPDVSNLKKRNWPRHFFRLAVTALGSTVQR
jgi:capsular polysaccharide biosynthesis protein